VPSIRSVWVAITGSRFAKVATVSLPKVVDAADKIGKMAIIVTIVSYFWEASDRTKARHYQAWQLIDLARGGPGDGGRRTALEDLVRDGVSLEGVDLSRANLDKLDLRSAQLGEAIFTQSSLNNTKLQCKGGVSQPFDFLHPYIPCRHTVLSGATFLNSRMYSTNFNGAAIYGAKFAQDDTLSPKQDYRDCIIASASFDKTRLQGTTFINCKIGDTTFENAILFKVSFVGGTLVRLDFTESLLEDVSIDGTEILPSTNNLLSSIDFSGAELKNVTINNQPVTALDGKFVRLCHTEVNGVEINRDCRLLGGEHSERSLEWVPSKEDRAAVSKWRDN
jgi:uncharacterized protein YjbI with pentapeptide repeats